MPDVYDPQEEAVADLQAARECGRWEAAVEHLRGKLPYLVKEQIRRLMLHQDPEEPSSWMSPFHFTAGMAIRNLLRDAGFGEKEMGVTNLDNIYVELVEEVADS